MRSIPTDLLRTFVTIIDVKGYTRAGDRLGKTQPTISAQIKRLQDLLGVQLFSRDVKEAGGVYLSEEGEVVASYARRILLLNDEMMLRISRRDKRGKLRLGIPSDYADHFMPKLMAGLTDEQAGFTFEVVCDLSHVLLKGLRDGQFDIVVAMTNDGPAENPFMTWREKLAWVSGPAPEEGFGDPLRIVSFPEGCIYRRSMMSALQRSGRSFELVYSSPSQSCLETAIANGFGISVLAERVISDKVEKPGPEAGLPRLDDAVVGIYVNERARPATRSFAARFADMFVEHVGAA
ncbi:LysR family transcriptional regulator [Paracoccus aminophilus]|nr:LysR family transcriptional regulator [Paracoccus aminophilus]